MKTILTKNNEELLRYAFDYGIDLWSFNIIFNKYDYDYNFYNENWREITRLKLEKEIFERILKLVKKYKGKNK